jgi:hypothetical protein
MFQCITQNGNEISPHPKIHYLGKVGPHGFGTSRHYRTLIITIIRRLTWQITANSIAAAPVRIPAAVKSKWKPSPNIGCYHSPPPCFPTYPVERLRTRLLPAASLKEDHIVCWDRSAYHRLHSFNGLAVRHFNSRPGVYKFWTLPVPVASNSINTLIGDQMVCADLSESSDAADNAQTPGLEDLLAIEPGALKALNASKIRSTNSPPPFPSSFNSCISLV